MYGTILALLGVVIVTWVWVTRGFFSAFLHLLCVVAAGAIAFAVYEPLTMLVLTQAPERGFLSILADTAHGIALAGSFAVSLALLRVAVDKAVPANLKFSESVEFAGAGVCGLGSAIITVGITLIALSMMRFGPDTPTKPVVFTDEGGGARGSLVRNDSFFRPYVDELTSGLYEWLSDGSLATKTPLSRWHPNFHELGATMRITYDQKSRNVSRPDEYEVQRWYALGDTERGEEIRQLMNDRWFPDVSTRVLDLEGNEVSRGYIAGVVVRFTPAAREASRGAKVVVGNGQVRLVAEDPRTGDTRAFHPSAVFTQAEGDDPSLVRFRYDSDNVFFASVGGGGNPVMAFEFALPPGLRPIAMYFRGIRTQLDPEPDGTFRSVTQRDQAAATFEYGGVDLDAMDDSNAITLATRQGRRELRDSDYHVYIQDGFAGRIQLKKGTERGLQVQEEDRGYTVVGGVEQYTTDSLTGGFIDRKLRISGFAESRDIRTVQVDVGRDSPLALNSRAFQELTGDEPPMLVDDTGQVYPPVGYTAVEDALTYIGFTPGNPISRIGDLPFSVSRSKPRQDVRLIYRVSTGVTITAMVAGDTVIARWEPPIPVEERGR